MERLLTELRHALRRMRKSPGFTLVVVLTLALGIGANTAIFSLVNGILLRPLPYADPGSLVSVTHLYPSLDNLEPGFSAPSFRDVAEQTRTLERLAVETYWQPNLTGEGEPERLLAAQVTGDWFAVYGVGPVIGRTLQPFDTEVEGTRVAVLSHGAWRRVFGEDPAILGRTVSLDGQGYEVVGVMPPGFRNFHGPEQVDLWTPLTFSPGSLSDGARTNEFLASTGRIRAGASLPEVEREMRLLAERLKEDFPGSYPQDWSMVVHGLHGMATGEVRPALMVLVAAVVLVLLIACANVANLLLARASVRRREMAIRGAMGARAADVTRQLLVEGLLLSGVGAALGLMLASNVLSLLRATNPFELPRIEQVSLDGTVLLFTIGLAVLTGLIFGLVPALQLARADLQPTLREGGRGSGDRRGHTLRMGLVVAEVAFALTLLVGAGLLVRSFVSLQAVDPGFNPDRVLTLNVALPPSRYETPEARHAFHEELTEQIRSLPGVLGVSRASKLPFTEGMSTRSFMVEGMELADGEPPPWGDFRVVDHHFHETMQIPLLAGRLFSEADRFGAPGVVLVDSELARRYWPGEEAVGRRVAYDQDAEGNPVWLEVVGVVGHTAQEGLAAEPRVQIYRPHAQFRMGTMFYAVRTAGEPMSLMPAVRATVRQLDADLPVADVATMRHRLRELMGSRRMSTSLVTLFAGVALLLAALGIYGVIAFDVNRRTQEMGVRMALGADRGGILLLVMRRGLQLTGAGIVIGLLGAFVLTRLLSSQLFGVGATDPITFLTVPLTLLAVAALACFLPARRATRVEPVVALRAD